MANDGSAEDSHGKVLFFSFDRFVEQIVKRDNCFVCGVSPANAVFNDEHALPDWILRRYELHSQTITLPNQTGSQYKHLKIPCCKSCNSLMGDTFEKPLREMFQLGYSGFTEALKAQGPGFLFEWLALIFLKMHLKDKNTRMYQDSRKGDATISELYDWEELHHIHCISRRFYTGLQIDNSVAGSLLVLPAKSASHIENFDFLDLHLSQTMLLRIDDIVVLSTLNDHCAGSTVLQERIRLIEGPLSPLQIRELAASLAYVNLNLSPRPRFFSEFDQLTGEGRVFGEKSFEFNLPKFRAEEYGRLLYHLCEDFLRPGASEILRENVKSGRWTFLTGDDGKFAHDSFDLMPLDSGDLPG